MDSEKIIQYLKEICETPSPTGYTKLCEKYLVEQFTKLGYKPYQTNKGAVIVPISEKEGDNGLLLSAHMDTLGLIVRSVKPNGRLRTSLLGDYPYNYAEQENVLVHTREGKQYTGTVRLNEPAVHGSKDPYKTDRKEETMEVVLDLETKSREETLKYGIQNGDYISFDPRFTVSNGFVKSRHLDDKASSAILLALAEELREKEISRPLYMMFTNYEEVGHGASAAHPKNIRDMIAVDMGVVYDDLSTDEYTVSICAKDSSGPYNYDLTGELIDIAKEASLNYAVDIYPFYGSDASAALRAGHDYRTALVGAGIAASHGYERTHEKGLWNTFELLKQYILKEKHEKIR